VIWRDFIIGCGGSLLGSVIGDTDWRGADGCVAATLVGAPGTAVFGDIDRSQSYGSNGRRGGRRADVLGRCRLGRTCCGTAVEGMVAEKLRVVAGVIKMPSRD